MLKGRRTTYSSGGVRRLIFTGNTKTTLFNKYNHGSGVGALNSSVRRALLRRAANPIRVSLVQVARLINTNSCSCTCSSMGPKLYIQ